jgi:predicted RNA-binding protein with PUA-like domain
VDVHLLEKYSEVIGAAALKANPVTAELSIFKQGRLSIAPVSAGQWKAVQKLAPKPRK